MGVSRNHHTIRRKASEPRDCGFSILELMAVLAVTMIVSAMATPLISNSVKQYRLHRAGTDYANLLQEARMRAIQDDQYYTVLTAQDATTGGYYAFLDLAQSGIYASPDPIIFFPQAVTPEPFNSGPAVANLEGQFLPAGSTGTVATTAVGPTFGPRGLPCTTQTVGGSGGLSTGTACPYVPPTSFITFLQSGQTSIWEAVTVTPAARIREWSCSDGSTWTPMN